MLNRFINLFRREKVSKDVTRELEFHITERAEQLISSGVPARDAVRQAFRQFGAYTLHKEDTSDADLLTWLGSLAADVRYALRGLANSPGFAVVAILSLALGIGANTAIFSLIDAVLLRPLPVSHPEQLMQITSEGEPYFTNPMWEQLRDQQDVFAGMAVWGSARFNLATGGEMRRADGDYVNGGYFTALGLNAVQGRTLLPSDDRRGCPGVAVLDYNFWRTAYGGDPAAVGKNIMLTGHPFQIVGVAPRGFMGMEIGREAQIFIPICSQAILQGKSNILDHRSAWWLQVLGRSTGVSEAQAKARLAVLWARIAEATMPAKWSAPQQDKYRKRGLGVDPASTGFSEVRKQYRDALLVLMGAVGFVLLIACANVANLLLARSATRMREMAVRLALGAGRVRLIRQMLTESLILSLAGAALGLVFAQWGSRLLAALISHKDRAVELDLAIDWRMLAFTATAAIVTGLFFGLMPALRSSGVSPNAAMKAGGRGIAEGHSRMRLGKALVVVQVALSLVLVSGAGLMLRTFRNLSKVDPGFRSKGVLLIELDLHQTQLIGDKEPALAADILQRVRAIPGVRSASAAVLTPLGHAGWNETTRIEGQPARAEADSEVYFNAVSDRYFETLGTRMVDGRDFTAHDNKSSPKVAIINESTAHKFFGNASPLGHSLSTDQGKAWSAPAEIVGVVRDAKYTDLREKPRATAYVPLTQNNEVEWFPGYQLSTDGSAMSLMAGVKEAVGAVDPGIAISFTPFEAQVAESLTRERMLATLAGFFGGLALLLAALGLYGVLAYNVARRRNEIGIRMALGAARPAVLQLILREAGRLTGVGLVLGVAGALAAMQVVKSFLFGLQPNDPPTLAGAAAVLAGVAAIAAYLPARRASMVDPMTALRDE